MKEEILCDNLLYNNEKFFTKPTRKQEIEREG